MNPLCCIAPVSIDRDRSSPGQCQVGADSVVRPVNPASKPSLSAQVSSVGADSDRLTGAAGADDGASEARDSKVFGGGGGVSGSVAGVLYKWVNYGKGWRSRWFALEDGVLSYYKVHGPDKIVMSPTGDKGVRVIGEESRKYMRKAGWRSSNGRLGGGSLSSRKCKPFGEVHLKVSSIRASRSDDKRLSIFTGTKTLHLRCATRDDRAAWIEALGAAKDLFPRVLTSSDFAPSENFIASTEKLRSRLSQEGLAGVVIEDCESIMLSEFSELQSQLDSLHRKHSILLNTLSRLEAEKIELETTVVDETKERDSFCGQGNRRFSDFYSVMSEGSGSESGADIESRDGVDAETDEEDNIFFDTEDFLSSEALRSASYRSKEITGSSCIADKDSFFSDRLSGNGKLIRAVGYPYVERRDDLPEPKEKEKPVGLWSIIKDNIGKDLSGVCLPVYFNEPLSSLQKCYEDFEYSCLVDQALEWGKQAMHQQKEGSANHSILS